MFNTRSTRPRIGGLRSGLALGACALFALTPVSAAFAADPPAPPVAAALAHGPAFPDGLPVEVTLQNEMKSGVVKEGDQVPFTVTHDVFDTNGHLIAKAGTPAFGHVVQSSHRGMLGKPGKLEFTCDYIAQPDGTHIPLRNSEKTKYGQDNRAVDVAAAVLLTPIALLVKGNDVTARQGQDFHMYVDSPAWANGGRCSFTLNDGSACIGTVTKFDGQVYVVHTDQGDRTIKRTDVKTLNVIQ